MSSSTSSHTGGRRYSGCIRSKYGLCYDGLASKILMFFRNTTPSSLTNSIQPSLIHTFRRLLRFTTTTYAYRPHSSFITTSSSLSSRDVTYVYSAGCALYHRPPLPPWAASYPTLSTFI